GAGSPAAGPGSGASPVRRFSASAPVSGGASSGYPVAGSAPHPSSARITLDERDDGDTSWRPRTATSDSVPRAGSSPDPDAATGAGRAPSSAGPSPSPAGRSPLASGERDAFPAPTSPPAPPPWPPSAERRRAQATADDGPPVTVDLSGRVTPTDPAPTGRSSATGDEDPAGDNDAERREPGVDTTAILELPPGRTESSS
ncbi:hypothetical protein AB0C29_42210, partial [Actinoplanes sp. NPDC048791]